MTAAAAARKITQYDGPDWITVGVKASAVIYHGTMVAFNTTGIQAVPATTALTAPKGVADLQEYDGVVRQGQASVFNETTGNYVTGTSDGAIKIVLRQGVFKMNNKAGDLVTTAHLGLSVYVEDDQTVRATAAGSVAAGILVAFDDRDNLPLVAIGCGAQYGRA